VEQHSEWDRPGELPDGGTVEPGERCLWLFGGEYVLRDVAGRASDIGGEIHPGQDARDP